MKAVWKILFAVLGYASLYVLSLWQLQQSPTIEAGEMLAVLLIFGLGFSLLAFVASIRVQVTSLPVRQPASETGAIALFLLAFAVLFLGWGLSAIKTGVPEGRLQETIVVLAKLFSMVLLPMLVLRRFGYGWRDLTGGFQNGRGHTRVLIIMAVALLTLQLTIGRGPKQIAALGEPVWLIALMAVPALIWMTLEAGLTEEFLFRVLLQTRLAAWFRSETAAIVLMALIFGLVHAPGYVLRDAHLMEGMSGAPELLAALAYSIVVVSPIGLMFGVLWARTRNFWLLVLLHGWTDLLPNLAPFIKTWWQ